MRKNRADRARAITAGRAAHTSPPRLSAGSSFVMRKNRADRARAITAGRAAHTSPPRLSAGSSFVMRKNRADRARAITAGRAAHTPPPRLSAGSSLTMRKNRAAGAQPIITGPVAHTSPHRLSAMPEEKMNPFGGRSYEWDAGLAARACVAPLRTYFHRSARTRRYSTASPYRRLRSWESHRAFFTMRHTTRGRR